MSFVVLALGLVLVVEGLAMALARSVAVHPTATVGRAADMVNAATLERNARNSTDDDLIPRLRAV